MQKDINILNSFFKKSCELGNSQKIKMNFLNHMPTEQIY